MTRHQVNLITDNVIYSMTEQFIKPDFYGNKQMLVLCFILITVNEAQLLPVEEDNLHVHVFSVLVEKVFEEVRDGLVSDVTTDYDVPAIVV